MKRKLYAELVDGFAALADERAGKCVLKTHVIETRFENVWDALEDTVQQAAIMRARSELLMTLQQGIQKSGKPESEMAQQLDITLLRLDELVRGKIDRFTLEELFGLASLADLEPKIEIRPSVMDDH